MSYSLSITQAISIMMYISVKMHLGHFEYLSTKYISEKLGIPAPSVSKIIKYLLSNGLIVTKEGSGGGILLAKDPNDITLLDIFLAIENKKPLFKKLHIQLTNEQAQLLKKNMSDALNDAEQAMKESLENTRLSDLIKDYNPKYY